MYNLNAVKQTNSVSRHPATSDNVITVNQNEFLHDGNSVTQDCTCSSSEGMGYLCDIPNKISDSGTMAVGVESYNSINLDLSCGNNKNGEGCNDVYSLNSSARCGGNKYMSNDAARISNSNAATHDRLDSIR